MVRSQCTPLSLSLPLPLRLALAASLSARSIIEKFNVSLFFNHPLVFFCVWGLRAEKNPPLAPLFQCHITCFDMIFMFWSHHRETRQTDRLIERKTQVLHTYSEKVREITVKWLLLCYKHKRLFTKNGEKTREYLELGGDKRAPLTQWVLIGLYSVVVTFRLFGRNAGRIAKTKVERLS